MNKDQLNTPVVLLIFNRPNTTKLVFNEIARARPGKLLVVADGPRPDRDGEREKCDAARSVIKAVDWPCEVSTNFSEINLGCRNRVSSGLDWVFSMVDEAIILEDDCLPHPDFFRFCADLLERYRNDDRICHIGGANYQMGKSRTEHSYYFSRYCHVWGWATWKRAWKEYDVKMEKWPKVRDEKWLDNICEDKRMVQFWKNSFDSVSKGEVDTWDVQWLFAAWMGNGLAIVPECNLISNIGFGIESTHTKTESKYSRLKIEEMILPVKHPSKIGRNILADQFVERDQFSGKPFIVRLVNKVFRLLRISFQFT